MLSHAMQPTGVRSSLWLGPMADTSDNWTGAAQAAEMAFRKVKRWWPNEGGWWDAVVTKYKPDTGACECAPPPVYYWQCLPPMSQHACLVLLLHLNASCHGDAGHISWSMVEGTLLQPFRVSKPLCQRVILSKPVCQPFI